MPHLTSLLHQAEQAVAAAHASSPMPFGMTPRRFAVLKAIAVRPDQTQTDLTSRTRIDRSTMSCMLRRLADAGFVTRKEPQGDSRAWLVNLTDKGRRALEGAAPRVEEVDKRLLGLLSGNEQKALMKALEKLAAHRV